MLTANLVELDEVVARVERATGDADLPPEAADEVGDNHGDDDQTNDLEDVQQHILHRDVLFSGSATGHQTLDGLLKPLDINKLDQPWQPGQTKQLGDLTSITLR